MKTPVRRALGTAALVLVLPLSAACGFNSQTDQVYQGADGPDDRTGQVDILNAIVVSDGASHGRFAGTLVNNSQASASKLVGVSGSDAQSLPAQIDVPASGVVNLATNDQPVVLTGPQLKPGDYVKLTFSFANGQSTTMSVPVMPRSGDYADITVPTAAPTPAPTGKPSQPAGKAGKKSGKKSGKKAKPSASPSSSPTAG